MVGQGVHGQGPQPRIVLGAQPGEPGHGGEVVRLSGAGLVAEGIRAQVAARRLLGDAPLCVQPQQLPCGGLDLGARVQDDRCEIEEDTGEDPAERGHREPGPAEHQPQGGDAVLQVGEHRVAVRRRVPLADVPAADGVARGPASSYEGREAGETRRGRGVVRGVQRTGAQPVLQRGGQGFLGLSALDVLARLAQHARNEAVPLLVGCVRELGGQLKPVVRQDRHARMLGQRRKGAAGGTAVTLPSIHRPRIRTGHLPGLD